MLTSLIPLWQIALAAVIASITSFVVLLVARRNFKNSLSEMVIIALVVGVSLLVWRLASNFAPFTEDPIPLVSPSDALCPIVTYVFLGLYATIRQPGDQARFARTRAMLTLVSFIVSVVVI